MASQADDQRMKNIETDIHDLKKSVEKAQTPNYQLFAIVVACLVPVIGWVANNYVTEAELHKISNDLALELKDAQLKNAQEKEKIHLSIAELKMLILSQDYRESVRQKHVDSLQGK